MHSHSLHHHHLSWCSSFLPYSTVTLGSAPRPLPLQPPLSYSSQVDRLASSKGIYTNSSSSPPLHRLIFFLPLVLVTWCLYLTYFSLLCSLYPLWTSSTSALNPCPHSNNSHILHKRATNSNLGIQPCFWSPIISLPSTCPTLNWSALSRLFK